LGEDLGEIREFGDVSDEPQKIRVEEHNFPPMFVEGTEARLVFEVVRVGDARRQIRW
jgi:hypothetical protein